MDNTFLSCKKTRFVVQSSYFMSFKKNLKIWEDMNYFIFFLYFAPHLHVSSHFLFITIFISNETWVNVYYVEDVTRAEQIKFPFNDPTNYPIIFIMCNTHDVLYYMLQEMNNYINRSFEFMMNSVFF